jgi:uncharacterized Zn finger protein (UPF0148 family)
VIQHADTPPVTTDTCEECGFPLHESADGTLTCSWRLCGAYGQTVEDDNEQEND